MEEGLDTSRVEEGGQAVDGRARARRERGGADDTAEYQFIAGSSGISGHTLVPFVKLRTGIRR